MTTTDTLVAPAPPLVADRFIDDMTLELPIVPDRQHAAWAPPIPVAEPAPATSPRSAPSLWQVMRQLCDVGIEHWLCGYGQVFQSPLSIGPRIILDLLTEDPAELQAWAAAIGAADITVDRGRSTADGHLLVDDVMVAVRVNAFLSEVA